MTVYAPQREILYLNPCLRVAGRFRSSFNVERMVVHTVHEVKGWGDHAAVLSGATVQYEDAVSTLYNDDSVGGTESGALGGGKVVPYRTVRGRCRFRPGGP